MKMSSDRMQILFIINSLLDKRKGGRTERIISSFLDQTRFKATVLYSQSSGHAEELALQNRDHYQVIVAAGGDGTVNQVAGPLVNSSAVLGILPLGSGKGLARSLGIPMNIRKAVQAINRFKLQRIDTGLINEHRFFNISGIGFDAEIAHALARNCQHGFFAYAYHIIRSLPAYKSIHPVINANNQEIRQNCFLVSIANSPQWGYGSLISPGAKLNDGLLDLCILKKFPIWKTPSMAFRLFTGTIENSRYMEIIRTDKLTLSGAPAFTGHIDGEALDFTSPVNVSIVPESLAVITGY